GDPSGSPPGRGCPAAGGWRGSAALRPGPDGPDDVTQVIGDGDLRRLRVARDQEVADRLVLAEVLDGVAVEGEDRALVLGVQQHDRVDDLGEDRVAGRGCDGTVDVEVGAPEPVVARLDLRARLL